MSSLPIAHYETLFEYKGWMKFRGMGREKKNNFDF
jgi:hypothetical protein